MLFPWETWFSLLGWILGCPKMFRQTHWSGLGNYDSMMMLEWNISLCMCVCATDTFSLMGLMFHFALQSGASAIQSKTKKRLFLRDICLNGNGSCSFFEIRHWCRFGVEYHRIYQSEYPFWSCREWFCLSRFLLIKRSPRYPWWSGQQFEYDGIRCYSMV